MGIITMQSSKTAWTGRLVWEYTGGSVKVSMYTGKSDGYPSSSTTGAYFSATITVGGSSKSFSYQQQEIDMYVGAVTVPVSGSTVTISGRVDAPYGVSMYGYPLTGSETVTLSSEPSEPEKPKIEPSQISLSANSVQMGKNLLISISAEDPNCRHILTCWFPEDDSEDILTEDAGTSYVWTVPDMVERWPDKVEITAWITCYTVLDDVYVGYAEEALVITVPDATTPSVEGGELTMGQTGEVLCARNSQSFTQKLELEFYGTTIQIAEGKIDSAQWTPGYELANLIPTLTYGTGTLKCTTMNGTAVVGTGTVTIRLHVPDNEVTRPKFTEDGLTISPVSNLGSAFSGLYIRGKSGVQAEMEASSDYSHIVSYQLTVGSTTAEGNPAVIDTLVSEGNVRVVARAVDARGYSTTVTAYIDVLPYKRPRITPYPGYSDVICERALENGELSSKGTYLAIRAGVEYTSILVDGEDRNRSGLAFRWRPSNSGSFTQWETLLDTSDGTTVSVLIGNIVTSLETSYVVELGTSDMLGEEHIMTFQIMTEAVSFVLYDGEDGAGFGKYPEEAHVVDIASHMTLIVRGGMQVLGETWVDLGLANGVSDAAFDVGRKPDSGCHMLVANGNHVYLAFDCSFEYTGVPIRINRDKIPGEYCPKGTMASLCIADESAFANVSADSTGDILVNWIFDTKNGSGPMTVRVLDGYIDYWI